MHSLASYNTTGSSSPFPSNQINYNNQPSKMAYTPTNSDHLNNILDNVASQIQQLDRKVKWKLELTIIDDQPHHSSRTPQSDSATTHLPLSSSTQPNSVHRLSSLAVSESTPTPQPPVKETTTLAVTSRTQYPWDFDPSLAEKSSNLFNDDTDDLQQQLKQSYDRQKYLQDIVNAQAEQISRSYPLSNEAEQAIATMRSIYLSMGNEQKLRYTAEINIRQKEIEILGRKLHRLANILRTTENIPLSSDESNLDKDDLLLERRQLLRKLHLYELRLSARDVEMNYIIKQHDQQLQQLQPQSPSLLPLKRYNSNISTSGRGSSSPDLNKTARQSPTPQLNRKGGSPYLFQQQYSPKLRSSVRPSSTHRHHQKLSGIDSLGYLADQMLSDPDFDHNNASPAMASSPLKQSTALSTTTSQHPPQSDQRQIKTSTQKAHSVQPSEPTIPSSSSSHQQYPDRHANDKTVYENPEVDLMTRHQNQSKRPIPILSSSFRPNTEIIDTAGHRVKLFNVAHWTPTEDAQLRSQVLLHGPLGHWGDIASTLPGRSPQQCQERWGMIHSAPTKP